MAPQEEPPSEIRWGWGGACLTDDSLSSTPSPPTGGCRHTQLSLLPNNTTFTEQDKLETQQIWKTDPLFSLHQRSIMSLCNLNLLCACDELGSCLPQQKTDSRPPAVPKQTEPVPNPAGFPTVATTRCSQKLTTTTPPPQEISPTFLKLLLQLPEILF